MVKRSNSIFGSFDILLFTVFIALLFFGWLNIYSAALNPEHLSIFDQSQEYGKQFLWICVSLGVGFFIMLLDGGIFKQFSMPFYGITTLLLIAVLIFGKKVNGATSWFGVGSFGIQPSEFAKLGLALFLSFIVSEKISIGIDIDFNIFGLRIKIDGSTIFSIAIISIPALLIALQPDPGTMLVFLSLMFVMYREGLLEVPLYFGLLSIVISILTLMTIHSRISLFDFQIHGHIFLILGIILVVGLVIYLINYFAVPRKRPAYIRNSIVTGILSVIILGVVSFVYDSDKYLNSEEDLANPEYKKLSILKEHHKNRIDVLFGHKEDNQGIGYNVNQSKIAIGSGGGIGKGYTNGTLTKYKHVPMQSTDFIFCTIGEEWGFLGSALIVLMFFFMLFRIIAIGERQRSSFTRVYAYCIASIFFFHFLINIGMTIGLAPVIGIPLPFFSYGGSSLIVFSAMIFILLKLDSERLDILR